MKPGERWRAVIRVLLFLASHLRERFGILLCYTSWFKRLTLLSH
jgi:hypothetical protein